MLADLPDATDEELRESILDLIRTPLSDRLWYIADGLRVGLTVEDIHGATEIDVWFLEQMRQIIAFEQSLRASAGEPAHRSEAPQGQGAWVQRPPDCRNSGGARPRCAGATEGAGRRADLLTRRHLRRGVPRVDPVHVFDVGPPERSTVERRSEEGDDPRRGPQPHRSRDRVRLLLRARLVRPQRDGLRDHHGELQPRDGLHRLRHVGQAVLRATDLRRRDAHRRVGEARRRPSCSSVARHP